MTIPLASSPAANARGALLLCCALGLFTVEITVIRLLGARHETMQLVLWRAASQLALLMPLILSSRGTVLRSQAMPLHLLRGLLSAVGLWTFFYAFSRLPLAFATAISFTQPLFLVLLAVLALKERVERRRMAATVVGFLGALVVIRPGAVPVDPATAVAVFGALGGAGLMIVTKALSRTETTMTIMAWVGLSTTAIFLVPGLWVWTAPRAEDAGLFALLSLAGPLGQLLLINAFRIADASALAPIDFTRLIMAAAAGYALLGEIPDLWTVLGAAIIVGSALAVMRRQPATAE